MACTMATTLRLAPENARTVPSRKEFRLGVCHVSACISVETITILYNAYNVVSRTKKSCFFFLTFATRLFLYTLHAPLQVALLGTCTESALGHIVPTACATYHSVEHGYYYFLRFYGITIYLQ